MAGDISVFYPLIGAAIVGVSARLCVKVGELAEKKGYSARKYRLLSFFVTPIIGFHIVWGLEDKAPQDKNIKTDNHVSSSNGSSDGQKSAEEEYENSLNAPFSFYSIPLDNLIEEGDSDDDEGQV